MHNVTLTFPRKPIVSSVTIGEQIIEQLLKKSFLGKELCLVIDSQVAHYYYAKIEQWLKNSLPSQYVIFVFPSGEQNKNIITFQNLLQLLLDNKFSRALNIVAIGGGVVGDLTGFVAATYLRGVNFIYCPTTLLAQIDAAIGGKTAINLPEGKNLLGVFYPPQEVICDSFFLKTLPEREWRSALAEALKHGLICSKNYVKWLEDNIEAILNRDPIVLHKLIADSIRLKTNVVLQDIEDHGARQYLNFGHTIGHALESATEYQQYLHGEAVSIGMMVAMQLSEEQVGLSKKRTKALGALLTKFGLPVTLNFEKKELVLKIEKIIHYLKQDKKKRANRLNWVFLKEIEHPIIVSIVIEGTFEESLKRILLSLKPKEERGVNEV